jgi:hypothetical protein
MASNSPYKITSYSRKQAARLGVSIRPSTNKKKKIDVIHRQTKKKIASIGARGYNDYPTFIAKNGIEYADKRRKLYKMRHEKDRHIEGSAGYYADKILW